MRYPDWQSRFSAVLKEYRQSPFVWGEHDCCLFAADMIRAMTGLDPAESFRGRYTTAIEAFVVIEQSGADSFVELVSQVCEQHGFPDIDPAFAQRGDIGITNGPPFGDNLGVCIGQKFAFLGESQMLYKDHAAISKSWRVG